MQDLHPGSNRCSFVTRECQTELSLHWRLSPVSVLAFGSIGRAGFVFDAPWSDGTRTDISRAVLIGEVSLVDVWGDPNRQPILMSYGRSGLSHFFG